MKLIEFISTPAGRVVSLAEWARRVGVTRGYLCQLRDDTKTPSIEVAWRIEKVTDGQVTMQDWVKDPSDSEKGEDLGGSDDGRLRREASTAV